MEGRYPNGILMSLSESTDPAREDEFNYWYNHVHIPDCTVAPMVLHHGCRFIDTNPDPKPGDGKYVAIYETDWEDVAKAREAVVELAGKIREQGRYHPLFKYVKGGFFKKIGGEFYSSTSRPVRGLLAVVSNPKDPAKEEEFNRWYNDIHVPDILDTGLYHSAYRFENIAPEASGGKYLAIYETDQSDPGKASDELQKLRLSWEQNGRFPEIIDVVYRVAARRIWPMD